MGWSSKWFHWQSHEGQVPYWRVDPGNSSERPSTLVGGDAEVVVLTAALRSLSLSSFSDDDVDSSPGTLLQQISGLRGYLVIQVTKLLITHT